MNKILQKLFDKKLLIEYRRNTNFYQLIGGNRIFRNKVVRKSTKQLKQSGHCSPYLSRLNFDFKQVKKIKTSQRYRINETFQIFYYLTCKSENLIYILQCHLCQLQYAGKRETPFSIRLNNDRKDAKSQASVLKCKNFNEQNHNFQQHPAFIINWVN